MTTETAMEYDEAAGAAAATEAAEEAQELGNDPAPSVTPQDGNAEIGAGSADSESEE